MRQAARVLRLAPALAQLAPCHFNWLIDGANNVANANLGGIGRQAIAALRAANASDQSGAAQTPE